jgi:hypothetical protein
MATSAKDPAALIGRSVERLSVEERVALAGKFIALEIYSPERLPLARIEAVGDSPEACIRQLAARGLNPRNFELTRLKPPY